jgi:hypothetical protein
MYDSLEGTSFSTAHPKFTQELQIVLRGPEKTGKTYLPLMTAPQPVAYLNGDRDNSRLLGWALDKGRQVLAAKSYIYKLAGPTLIRTKMGMAERMRIEQGNIAVAAPRWQRWLKEYRAALLSPKIKTVVIDTGGWVYDTLRIAKYGTLTIPQHLAPEYKSEMASVIAESEGSGKLIVWLHREQDEYEDYTDDSGNRQSRKTGQRKTKGYAEMDFAVGAVVTLNFDMDMSGETPGLTGDGQRYARVMSGIGGRGKVFKGKELAIPNICAAITRSKPEDWK